jgi:hypothetical protein
MITRVGPGPGHDNGQQGFLWDSWREFDTNAAALGGPTPVEVVCLSVQQIDGDLWVFYQDVVNTVNGFFYIGKMVETASSFQVTSRLIMGVGPRASLLAAFGERNTASNWHSGFLNQRPVR